MKAPPKPCVILFLSKQEPSPYGGTPINVAVPKCDTHQHEWVCQSYDVTTKCPIGRIEELEFVVEKLMTLVSK
jgi:hypothetical protein